MFQFAISWYNFKINIILSQIKHRQISTTEPKAFLQLSSIWAFGFLFYLKIYDHFHYYDYASPSDTYIRESPILAEIFRSVTIPKYFKFPHASNIRYKTKTHRPLFSRGYDSFRPINTSNSETSKGQTFRKKAAHSKTEKTFVRRTCVYRNCEKFICRVVGGKK